MAWFRRRSFYLWLLIIGVVSATVAAYFDAPWANDSPAYVEAGREIAGAVVSGAFVAAAVVWFEQRREDEREKRDEERLDAEAKRAWQRDADLRIVSLLSGVIAAQRIPYLNFLFGDYRHLLPPTIRVSTPVEMLYERSGQMVVTISEVQALVDFRGQDTVGHSWEAWRAALDALIVAANEGNATSPVLALPLITSENEAWDALTDAVFNFWETVYPVD